MKKSIILAMVVAALACGPAWAYDEGPVMGPYTSIPGLTAIQQCQLTVAGKVMDPARLRRTGRARSARRRPGWR